MVENVMWKLQIEQQQTSFLHLDLKKSESSVDHKDKIWKMAKLTATEICEI